MGAELARQEYGWGYGIAAYTVAAGTAFLRLYNDRHWLNDVVAGAGIGILSAQAAYWLLPLERKLLKWDSTTAPLTIIPFTDGRSASLALTLQF
jgi:membrane-associated phospholipid phosphatase